MFKKLGSCVCVCMQEAGAGSADHDGAAAQPGGGEPGQPDGDQKPSAHGIAVRFLAHSSPSSFLLLFPQHCHPAQTVKECYRKP